VSEESLREFYNRKFRKEYGTDAVYLNPDPEHYHQKILERIKNGQVILDVGCATGYLGAVAKQKGNRVYGVEISEESAKKAAEILDDVWAGNIEKFDLPFPEKYFDIIICSDVLEHLFNPKQVLIKLRKYLKPNGELMVVVPNVAHYSIRLMLLLGRWEYENVGSMDYGHLRFFTKKSMANLLVSSRYKVKEIIPYIVLPPPLSFINKHSGKILSKLCKRFMNTIFAQSFLYVTEIKL